MIDFSLKIIKPKSFRSPYPWVGHLPFASWLIGEIKPKILVELGTHYGNSYFTFCQAVAELNIDTACYAIDTWCGEEHAGYYSEDVFNYVNAHNNENYRNFSTLLRMRFDEALSNFSDSSVDILHIDGLHTYEAVKHDFETWLKKMKPNGLVIFHDIEVRQNDFGVWKLWGELKNIYPLNIEFSHSHGLGVIQLDGNNQGVLGTNIWLSSNWCQREVFCEYFKNIGEIFELRGLVNSKDMEIEFHVNDILAYQTKLKYLEHSKEMEIQSKLDEIYNYQIKIKILEDKLNSFSKTNSGLFKFLLKIKNALKGIMYTFWINK